MFGLLIEETTVFKNLTKMVISLFKFGSFGSKEGQFNNPRQIAVDKDIKYVYVADSKNNRIQKFDSSGKFIKHGAL